MSALCKACFSTSETVAVQVRRGERGTPWEDSTIKRCANNDCWAIVEGTTEDKLTWIGNVYDYKYFGDYALSEEQLAAVFEALGMARQFVALSAENERLRKALEPFAAEAKRKSSLVLGPDIDHWIITDTQLTLGDVRLALAALEASP